MHVTEQHAEGLSEVVPAARVYHAAAAPLAADTDLAYGALIIFGGLGLASELHEVVRDHGSERRAQVQAYPVGSEGGYHSQQHDLLPDVWRLDANLDDLAGPSWEVRVRVGLRVRVSFPLTPRVRVLFPLTPKPNPKPNPNQRLESRDASTGVQPAQAYGASVAACAALHACGVSSVLAVP